VRGQTIIKARLQYNVCTGVSRLVWDRRVRNMFDNYAIA